MVKGKSRKKDLVLTTQERSRVIQLFAQGLTIPQIMTTTNLGRKTINKHYDEWLAAQDSQLTELAEMTGLRSLGRLEHMFGTVAQEFYGQMSTVDEEGSLAAIFDKHMADTMLKILKEQREWIKLRSGASDKKDTVFNAEHIEITMSSNNPLYGTARMNLVEEKESDWLQYADTEIDDLYVVDGAAVSVDDKISRLEGVLNGEPGDNEGESDDSGERHPSGAG